MHSPFFYVGDKYKLMPQLKLHFPSKIYRFIEPFCGGGSVFLNIEAKSFALNDINPYMIKLHKFLFNSGLNEELFFKNVISEIKKYKLSASFIGRIVSDDIKKQFVKTYYAYYNKDSFLKMREDYNKDKDNMMLLYLLMIYGFNRMIRFNSSGDFNLPVGNVDFNNNVKISLKNYFDFTRKNNIIFYNQDFSAFIRNIKPRKNDFIYFDPPYLITGSEYNKLWNEDKEESLIQTLENLNSKGIRFAVSNVISYKNRYNSTFSKWTKKYNIVKISSNYISYHDNTNKVLNEVLVKNY